MFFKLISSVYFQQKSVKNGWRKGGGEQVYTSFFLLLFNFQNFLLTFFLWFFLSMMGGRKEEGNRFNFFFPLFNFLETNRKYLFSKLILSKMEEKEEKRSTLFCLLGFQFPKTKTKTNLHIYWWSKLFELVWLLPLLKSGECWDKLTRLIFWTGLQFFFVYFLYTTSRKNWDIYFESQIYRIITHLWFWMIMLFCCNLCVQGIHISGTFTYIG